MKLSRWTEAQSRINDTTMTGTFVLTRGTGVQALRIQLKKYWSYIKLATLIHAPDQMTSALCSLFLQAYLTVHYY